MYKPILGEGLVTSEGDFWRRQRKLSAPAFHPARMAGYAAQMAASTSQMLDAWAAPLDRDESSMAAGHVRDVHADLVRLTLDIACRTLFGADASGEAHRVGAAMEQALQAIEVRFARLIRVPDWFPLPSNLRLRRAKQTLDTIVARFIESRRSGSPTIANEGDDLLSTLVQAREGNGSTMTDGQLLDEVRTLFLAGHETTALTLTYALHLLAENPGAQVALQEELSSVLSDRAPTYDDLPRLPFTRKVVLESMRLFPPADLLGREATADGEVGGIEVPQGTCVFMSQWVMHRDSRYFHDPSRFAPERWTEEFQRSLPRFAYFPFGGGPRVCIGQAFALAEAALSLAMICQRFSFARDPTFKLTLWPSITLRPRNGVRLRVLKRVGMA
jgi:cytochrome P450